MNPRMNPDLTTKVLLFAIATALWGLLLKPFWMEAELFPSIQAQTQLSQEELRKNWRERIEKLEDYYGLSGADLANVLLLRIESDVSDISDIKRGVSDIESDVSAIKRDVSAIKRGVSDIESDVSDIKRILKER